MATDTKVDERVLIESLQSTAERIAERLSSHYDNISVVRGVAKDLAHEGVLYDEPDIYLPRTVFHVRRQAGTRKRFFSLKTQEVLESLVMIENDGETHWKANVLNNLTDQEVEIVNEEMKRFTGEIGADSYSLSRIDSIDYKRR